MFLQESILRKNKKYVTFYNNQTTCNNLIKEVLALIFYFIYVLFTVFCKYLKNWENCLKNQKPEISSILNCRE